MNGNNCHKSKESKGLCVIEVLCFLIRCMNAVLCMIRKYACYLISMPHKHASSFCTALPFLDFYNSYMKYEEIIRNMVY